MPDPAASVTVRPRPATPVVVLATAAPLLVLIGAALAHRAFGLAAYLALAALVPWVGRERLRGAGVLLAHVGVAWCLFEIVRVPLGSRVGVVHVPAAAAFAARALALNLEATRRWAHPRWAEGVTAPIRPVIEALEAALRSRPGEYAAIDAAVVALAASPATAVPDGEAARRAFWINAYNVLALHAGRGRWSKRMLDALEVFRTRYRVAGVPFTLDDIEHGLLRNGAAPLAAPWARMGDADPRRRWAVALDPRIHFALNCGAASCPPVRVYRGEELDAQLEAAARSFLAAETSIDKVAGVIETSRILSWYALDFGGPSGIRVLIARALEVDEADLAGLRLRFSRYDWTSAR